MPPEIRGLLECPVYVDDLQEAHDFYHGILGFDRMITGDRIEAYNVAPGQVLIACQRGACDADSAIGEQLVPGHRMDGKGHFAFRIGREHLDDWRCYLTEQGIEIISEVTWPLGGHSLYFADPFGNVVELGTGGIWPNDPD